MEGAQPDLLAEVGRMDDPGRALPGEWFPGIPGRPDVEPAIGEDERVDAALDAHVDGADAILVAVGQADPAGRRELGDVADLPAEGIHRLSPAPRRSRPRLPAP